MEVSIDQKLDDGEQEQARLDAQAEPQNSKHREPRLTQRFDQETRAVIRGAVDSLPEKPRTPQFCCTNMSSWIIPKLRARWNVRKAPFRSHYCSRAYETLRVQLAPLMRGEALLK